jgi:hypothetical protein
MTFGRSHDSEPANSFCADLNDVQRAGLNLPLKVMRMCCSETFCPGILWLGCALRMILEMGEVQNVAEEVHVI